MASARPELWTPLWRRWSRPATLARDGGLCQIRGPSCTRIATCVDHIIPPARGGDLYDPANLRAACARCNGGRRDNPRPPAPYASRF